MNKKKKKSSNSVSKFLGAMGFIIIILTVWTLFTIEATSELYWLLLAIGVSLGVTERAVAWLVHIHVKQ